MVSLQDCGPHSRATEIVTGEISTVSTRRVSLPVMHMLDPPSTSGPFESLERMVTEVVSLQSIPQTRGDVINREMLAAVVSLMWLTDACQPVGGGGGVSMRAWTKEPLGNSVKIDFGGGSGGGRTAACAV